MLKKALAILTLATVAVLAIQPAATAAGPLPAVGAAPAANRGHGDDQGRDDDGNGQGENGQGNGQGENDQGEHHGGHGYVPSRTITITGLPIPGGTITIIFAPGSFRPGERVTIIIGGRTVGHVTLGAVKAEAPSLDKQAAADGSLHVSMTLPEDAAGTQTVTATGAESGNVGTAATTVVPKDVAPNPAPASLASTGSTLPMLLIWVGAGALLLGIAVVATLAHVRRRRPAA
jgi:hypothetical protein